MGLANKITITRILLIPVFMIFLLVRVIPYGPLIAALIFILAASTDGLDGYVARKNKEVTNFGKFLDPLADKLLISSALISLVALNHLNPWIAFIIISREFAVTGLRLVGASEGVVITASKLGKVKTVSQIVAVSAVILDISLKNLTFSSTIRWVTVWYPSDIVVVLTIAFAVALTMISGFDYFMKNIKFIKYTEKR